MTLMTAAEYFAEPVGPAASPSTLSLRAIRSIVLQSGCRLYQFPVVVGDDPSQTSIQGEGHPSRKGGVHREQPGSGRPR